MMRTFSGWIRNCLLYSSFDGKRAVVEIYLSLFAFAADLEVAVW